MRLPSKILVGLSGASGIIYGLRLIEYLSSRQLLEAVIYTKSAELVAYYEEGLELKEWLRRTPTRFFREDELAAPYASTSTIAGSVASMVVVPCSMKTLASIANGMPDNLLTRAALSLLRLKRPVILVVRETPLGLAELRNMLRAASNGAIILPASPAFYHKPKTISDLVDFITGKILDVLGVEHNLYTRWSGIVEKSDLE